MNLFLSLAHFTCINASTKGLQGSFSSFVFFFFFSSMISFISRAWQMPHIFIFSTLFSSPTCKETIDTEMHASSNDLMASIVFPFDHRIEHKKKKKENFNERKRVSTHVNDFNHFYHLCVTVIKTKRSSSINSLSHVNVCLLSVLFCFVLFTSSILPLTIRSMIKKKNI